MAVGGGRWEVGGGRWEVGGGDEESGLRVGFGSSRLHLKQRTTGSESPSQLALAGVLTLCHQDRKLGCNNRSSGNGQGRGKRMWVKQKNEPKKSKEKRSRYARKVNRTRAKAEKGQEWKQESKQSQRRAGNGMRFALFPRVIFIQTSLENIPA